MMPLPLRKRRNNDGYVQPRPVAPATLLVLLLLLLVVVVCVEDEGA